MDLRQRADEGQAVDADLPVGDGAAYVAVVEDAALGRAQRAVELVEQRDVDQRGLVQVEFQVAAIGRSDSPGRCRRR